MFVRGHRRRRQIQYRLLARSYGVRDRCGVGITTTSPSLMNARHSHRTPYSPVLAGTPLKHRAWHQTPGAWRWLKSCLAQLVYLVYVYIHKTPSKQPPQRHGLTRVTDYRAERPSEAVPRPFAGEPCTRT